MEVIEVTILNWREFNPESDRTRHPQWFRVNQNIASSESLFDLSPAQKWVWICILGLCCRKNSSTISLNLKHIAKLSGVKEREISQTIELLNQNKTLSVSCQSTVSPLTLHTDKHTDKQTIQTDKQDMTGAGSRQPLHCLAAIWNEFSGSLSKVEVCEKSRRQKAEALWKENPNPEYWKTVVKKIAESPFCNGENDRGWKADFDFFIKPSTIKSPATHIKVIEGKYDAKKSKTKHFQNQRSASADAEVDQIFSEVNQL